VIYESRDRKSGRRENEVNSRRGGVRRIMVFVVPILIVLAIVGFLHTRGILFAGSRGPVLPVDSVERRSIAVTIEATGVVEPIDLVEVKSKASGQILRMPVEVGSIVKSGDLLAQIDTVDVENQYEQALAAQRAAQAKVDISTAQKERADGLFGKGFLTVDEHESAVLDFANAQAQLVKAKTDFDSARQRRDDATVRAPIAGTVLEQLVTTGTVISSATGNVSGGTSLLKMADLSRIRMRAYVSETDIGSVRAGQEATVSVEAFPQRPFPGTVEKIEPEAVVQQSVTMFSVLISISNEERLLLPGMNGDVSMLVDRRDDVPAVSLDAVRAMRDLPTVALALGLNADSVSARLMRQARTRMAEPRQGEPRSGEQRTGGRPWRGAGQGSGQGFAQVRGQGRGQGQGPGHGEGQVQGQGQGQTSPGAFTGRAAGRAQFAFVKTANGLEPRLVRLGLSDFDYAQVLEGLQEGEEVALLSVAEVQAQRKNDQTRLQQRLGNGIPGSTASGSGRRSGGSGGATGGGGSSPPPPPPGGP
jgi:HlyD family secretion protein